MLRVMPLIVVLPVALMLAGCPEEPAVDDYIDPDVIVDEEAPPPEEVEAEEAPDFTVELAHDGEVSLADYEGRILVLDFWATWCTSCVRELPEYQELYDEWDQDQVEYLGMSLDTDMPIIEAFLDGRDDLTLPMALASEDVVEAYLGARRTLPSSRVIDGDGMIRYSFTGPATAQVGAAVEALLEEMQADADDAD